MALELRYAARSDVGLVRLGNEDSGYASPRLLVVADGMGGHAAGELASATAVAMLAGLDGAALSAQDALAALADAIDDIGDSIATVISDEPDLTGMGTTVTAAYWLGEQLALVHVGDSRCYLLRDGQLSQVTHDHTYVQTLVDAGRLTEQQASVHPRRSLLMRAIDGMNPVESDISLQDAQAGDRWLLCSDGLSGVLSAPEITSLLRVPDLAGCVTRLVEVALEHGAPDNVTVVVADVVDVHDSTFPDAIAPGLPVVVGAAGEPRVRVRLPSVHFPADAQPDPNRPDAPPHLDDGPPTAEQPLIDSDLLTRAARQNRRAGSASGHGRRRRRAWVIAAVALGVLIVVVAGSIMAAQSWLSQRWYVSINGNPGTGTVAIYNGIPGTFLGSNLSAVQQDSGLTVGSLPLFDQELVSKTIPAASLDDAERIVAELRAKATACQVPMPPAGCPGAIT